MQILGIHDGHTATACLLIDGTIRAALSEERLSGVKGQGGFPAQAVEKIARQNGLRVPEVDRVALAGRVTPLTSIDQYREGRQRYFPVLLRAYPADPRSLIRAYLRICASRRLRTPDLTRALQALGIPPERILLVDHHQAHAATAYYLSPFQAHEQSVLVVTLDGSGDGLSGTISVVDERGAWRRLKAISTFDSLGMVYSRATQYLGMKPWEHEYKLMGMAPYVEKTQAERAFAVFKRYLRLSPDGLGFCNPTRLWGNSLLKRMRRDLQGLRFDAVAAGVQMLHERMTLALMRNWMQRTGIPRIAVAGGCFMNVKANKLIAELEECAEVFIMPSCGDESCALGAALWCYAQMPEGREKPPTPLETPYWGPESSSSEIQQALAAFADRIVWRECADVEQESAQLLSRHKIVGRLCGKMEWGARALGNRSILANPSRPQNLRRLNAAIKMRDFWMPFAPAILWERRHDYAVITKGITASFMTLAHDSTPLAREHLIAALHPYDFTMRPQFVRQEHNPEFHRLISEFQKHTGIGGVLNTSFNLHGFPIVCTPQDAIRTLLRSELDCVTLEDILVWKKGTQGPDADSAMD